MGNAPPHVHLVSTRRHSRDRCPRPSPFFTLFCFRVSKTEEPKNGEGLGTRLLLSYLELISCQFTHREGVWYYKTKPLGQLQKNEVANEIQERHYQQYHSKVVLYIIKTFQFITLVSVQYPVLHGNQCNKRHLMPVVCATHYKTSKALFQGQMYRIEETPTSPEMLYMPSERRYNLTKGEASQLHSDSE